MQSRSPVLWLVGSLLGFTAAGRLITGCLCFSELLWTVGDLQGPGSFQHPLMLTVWEEIFIIFLNIFIIVHLCGRRWAAHERKKMISKLNSGVFGKGLEWNCYSFRWMINCLPNAGIWSSASNREKSRSSLKGSYILPGSETLMGFLKNNGREAGSNFTMDLCVTIMWK